jgi:hypothetical protein
MSYTITSATWGNAQNTAAILQTVESASVATSPERTESWAAFQDWLAAGNIPAPYVATVLREPRPLWEIREDLVQLTGSQKTAIWNDLISGHPPKLALDEGPNASSIWVMEWSATFGTAVAADKLEAKIRVMAFYTQDNPTYLRNPPFAPEIDIPGDQPVT